MMCPKIQVTITPEMLKILRELGAKTGNGVSGIVRQAVADYLDKVGLNGINAE